MTDSGRRVWTDGACQGNPGPGGWGWVDDLGHWANGAEAHSTNQRMEVMAAYRAVLDHPGEVTVVSDSTYVVNCFRDRWWEGWLERGWKNSQRKPVANQDLWEPFIDLYRSRSSELFFEWVKGHSGDPMNDVADRLAVAAAASQTEGAGDAVPDDLDEIGAEDTIGRPAPAATGGPPGVTAATVPSPEGRDRRLPAGRLVGVFGVRPPELGGYDPNPTAADVGRRVREILVAKHQVDGDLHVVSGLRLGAELLGAEVAVDAGLPLVVVLPFPDADAKWPAASRARFGELRRAAVAEVVLERKVPDSNAKVAGALRRRDAWLARNLDDALVVWNGDEPFVDRLVKSLRDRLGDDVWELPVTP